MVRRVLSVFSLITALLSILIVPAGAQSGRTFYIDYSSGSNSNNGTSKSTPWKTHPYMNHNSSCDGGKGPSYSHNAADQFIFKGGVTWPSACFAMQITAGGSSASVPDVYTTDQTWFNGGSFTRAIFDAQNNFNARVYTPSINSSSMIAITASNVTFGTASVANSGFDIRNYPIGSAPVSNCGASVIGVASGIVNVIVTQSWIHAMVLNTLQPSNLSYQPSAAMCANSNANASAGSNVVLDHSEVSNTENVVNGIAHPMGLCAINIGVQYTHCHDLFEGIRPFLFIHDTELNNINYPNDSQFIWPGGADGNGAALHLDTIQSDTYEGDGDVYNNYIHDVMTYAGTMNLQCSNHTYNNVVSNVSQEFILMDPTGSPGCTAYVYNNIFDGSTSTNPNNQPAPRPCGDATHGSVVWAAANNICIGAGGGAMPAYQMSSPEANQYGFTPATKYAMTSADPKVVGAGTNLSSSCGTLPVLCSDTAGAPWYGASYQQRGSSWDLGAYVAGGVPAQSKAPASKPNPPSSLAATVQ